MTPNPALLCRSMLFTSALNEERLFLKAEHCGADAGVLDLEDSVPPEHKEEARRRALSFLARPAGGQVWGLRVNSLRGEEGVRDLVALLDSGARPELIILPKVDAPEEVALVARVVEERLPSSWLCAVIETTAGLCAAEAIATASPRLAALIFGAADFAADMGVPLAWDSLLHARNRIALAAARARVAAVDAPVFRLREDAELERESRVSQRLGFHGKAALHPRQVPIINHAFRPSPEAVSQARKIVAASERSRGGICVVDGLMIGPPFVVMARRTLETAGMAMEVAGVAED